MTTGKGPSRGGRAARRTASAGTPRRPVTVPRGVRLASEWSWRLLLVGAAVAVIVFLVIQLRLIVIPLLIAILLAALLVPLIDWLHHHRWPRSLAIVVSLAVLVAVVGGLIFVIVWQVRGGWPDLQERSVDFYEGLRAWLAGPPLSISDQQLDSYLETIWNAVQRDSSVLLSGVLSVGSTIGHVLAGILLTLFATIFLLIDGKGIWRWTVGIAPRRARPALDGAGHSGWTTLVNFVRMQVFVAFIDAVGIGLGAALLQLPLVVPIAVLVFLGSFIPIVGAVATGALAVIVAFIYNGWVAGLVMLLIVIAVQQLEGHVLQPLVMGNAVRVHPLAVVMAVAAGTLLAGIPGALFAVPFVAVANVMIRHVASGRWRSRPVARPPSS